MRAPMLRSVLRFVVAAAVVASLASAVFGAGAGCGPFDDQMVWICLNAVTGKLDDNTYDTHNFVNGEPDPCHCYDPCGPAKTCPIVVDAGPHGSGCDAGP